MECNEIYVEYKKNKFEYRDLSSLNAIFKLKIVYDSYLLSQIQIITLNGF